MSNPGAAPAESGAHLPWLTRIAYGLGATAQNIGRLLNTKNIYFVPLKQDDCIKKPNSLVADFDKLEDCVILALQGKQHQPIFL